MNDTVDHPKHYGGDTPYEVIKVLEQWLTREEYIGFLKGNHIKYNARAIHKGQEDEDYRKAAWYQMELVRYMKEGKRRWNTWHSTPQGIGKPASS